MKSISKMLMVIVVLLSALNSVAQIRNAKTEHVKIYGNCDMCKATIEKAGNLKKTANVVWNKDTKMATLTYDSDKTNPDEILKRIALAGYDSEKFLAPDDVYAKLPGCCRYNRAVKPIAKNKEAGMDMKEGLDNHNHREMAPPVTAAPQNASQLKAVFEGYFSLKDALIKTDATAAAAKAAALATSVNAVEMNKLSAKEHTVWMNVFNNLAAHAGNISKLKAIDKQREIFAALSANIYELAKASKLDAPVYYQHCPMYNNGRGANWLSKENTVKNPYYGSQMLTCGSTVETLN